MIGSLSNSPLGHCQIQVVETTSNCMQAEGEGGGNPLTLMQLFNSLELKCST